MGKRSEVDRAIASLEGKKAVIQQAIDELKAMQQAKPKRTRKQATPTDGASNA